MIPVRSLFLALLATLSACSSAPVTPQTDAAAVAVPSQTASAEPSFDLASYRIAAEDVLDISVWEEPDLQKQVTVRPDGGITMPLIGTITAAGRTSDELASDLAEKLSKYVPDPVISVSVTEIRGLKIYISGRVAKPGEYRIGRYIDVLQALSLAGGLTPFAKQNDIRILRRSGEQESVFKFNYDQVRQGRKMDQNILLRPGDTVIVP